MMVVIFPLLMAVVVYGKLECDFPRAPQYYGILGKPVYLHIPIFSNTYRFNLKKDDHVILRGIKEDNALCHVYKSGLELFSSGSVKISRCMKNHSGEYIWETFDAGGNMQCDVTFMLQIQDHHHSHKDTNKNVESSLTPDCSSTNVRDQICVKSKVFLLLCGVTAMLLTLSTALCCFRIMLNRTPPHCDHSSEDTCRKDRRNQKEGETLGSMTVIYSEVVREMAPETGNQAFTTYGLN